MTTSPAGARDVIETCAQRTMSDSFIQRIQPAHGTCSVAECRSVSRAGTWLEAGDVAVALQWRHHDVEEPEEEEQCWGHVLEPDWTAQLAANGRRATQQHRYDADERTDAEDCDGEAQRASLHLEVVSLGRVVDGSYRPRDTDTEEHVDGIAAGDVADRRVGVLVVNGCHLAGKRVYNINIDITQRTSRTRLLSYSSQKCNRRQQTSLE